MNEKANSNNHNIFPKKFRPRGKPGARPGTLKPPEGAIAPTIRATSFGPQELEEQVDCDLPQVQKLREKHPVTWVDIVGFGDVEMVAGIGDHFAIHRLALEDVVSVPQRAKVEAYGEHLFFIAQFPTLGRKHRIEQVSFFLGKDYLISWRELPGEHFASVRHRLSFTGRAMRDSGPDYLFYALLDATIDSYFPILESVGDRIDRLDLEMEQSASSNIMPKIHGMRHDVRILRRTILPLRDAVASLGTRHQEYISKDTSLYLRDCQDHVVQIMDSLEHYRDACSDMRDYFATSVSNRMNEVIKLLTIISTIFIPLSFIAGVYGMNFNTDVSRWNMPELAWRFGYPLCLAFMASVAFAQLWYFRTKGWLGQRKKHSK